MSKDLISQINELEKTLNELRKKVSEQQPSNSMDELETLLASTEWPSAVDPDLLCNENSEHEKLERAEGIRDLFLDIPLQNKKILDFGCGEGHLVLAINQRNPKFVVGYDFYLNPNISIPQDKGLFTFDWNKVIENGPYNLVVMYDVVDHLENITFRDCLNKLQDVIAPGGKLYIRAHPFIARHGGHAYNKLNKAFVHLVLTEKELRYFYPNLKNYPTSKTIYPVKTYKQSIDGSGFREINIRVVNGEMENFFKKPHISSRIIKNLELTDLPVPQMSMQFVDIILQKI